MKDKPPPRKPRVFAPDDPGVVAAPEPVAAPILDADDTLDHGPDPAAPLVRRSGIAWGGLLVAAFAGLAGLAASVSFARFVSVAISRDDWVGWLAIGLLAVGVLAAVVVIGREIVGLLRLQRLAGLRRDADNAMATGDRSEERRVGKECRL